MTRRLTIRERKHIEQISGGSGLLAELAVDAISLRLDAEDAVSLVYSSAEEFILRHGRLFSPKPIPTRYRKWMRGLHGCFENSLELAVESGELAYVEGFALPGSGIPKMMPMPMAHAWCVDVDCNVVDPTWGGILAGREYCGLPLDKRLLWRKHERGEPFGILFDDACLAEVLSGRLDWRTLLPPGASGFSPERELPS